MLSAAVLFLGCGDRAVPADGAAPLGNPEIGQVASDTRGAIERPPCPTSVTCEDGPSGALQCRAFCGEVSISGTYARDVLCIADAEDPGTMHCQCVYEDAVLFDCATVPADCDACEVVFLRQWPDG